VGDPIPEDDDQQDRFCKESAPPARYEGAPLVQGRIGYPTVFPDEKPEYPPLDHPHAEPGCQFCAVRQTPTPHKLWCAVFLAKGCDCGYERPGR
jgi:hypothetical protein